MAADYYRRSGQIPAFGDWENVNELPITQYFECARQAGLLRCSCSRECGSYTNYVTHGSGDLYGLGYQKPNGAPQRKTRGLNKGGCQHSKEQRKQVKVVMNQPIRNQHNPNHHHRDNKSSANDLNVQQRSSINAKPVDEDLYKIPSELLANSKRKRMLGFFSRCMVPPCAA